MDILIKNMEMPSCCEKCFFVKKCSAHAVQLKKIAESEHEQIFDVFGEMRLSDCPLVELPSHGDLVNLGDVYEAINREIVPKGIFLSDFYKAFADIPTVLEASDGYNN